MSRLRSAIAPRRRPVTVRRITVRRLRRNIRHRARRRLMVAAEAIRKADIRAAPVAADAEADKSSL